MTSLGLITHHSGEFNEYDPVHHRVRCQGHIINLAADAFLSVTDPDNIDADTQHTVEEIGSWRKFGPLGRLHNVAVKIHASPQLYHQFLAISRGKTLPKDNSTRWLSWAKTIARAIELRGPIDQFFDLVMEETSDKLSEEDWVTLKIVSIPFSFIYVC